jgi:hypothetical protein
MPFRLPIGGDLGEVHAIPPTNRRWPRGVHDILPIVGKLGELMLLRPPIGDELGMSTPFIPAIGGGEFVRFTAFRQQSERD